MKNLIALLCVVSTLLGSVSSYKCYSCFSFNATTCNVSEMECLGDRCMTVSQFAYNSGFEFKSMFKACSNETLCGTKGAVAAKNIKFRFNVHCCSGNVCNTDEYELPKEDPTPNGVKCPTAFCTGTMNECKTDKEMNCTGSMDRCFDYRSVAMYSGQQEKKYSVKGCSNSDACEYNFDCALGVAEIQKTYMKC